MAVITSGKTFANGEQLSADKLNQVITSATFNQADAVDNSTMTIVGGAMAVAENGIVTAKIADSSSKTTGVTFAKMQHISTAKVLGRATADEGDIEEAFDFKDENDMSSDSATALASQQSIKAFAGMTPAQNGSGGGYSGGESVTLPNGLTMKMGKLTSVQFDQTFHAVNYGSAFGTAVISVQATIHASGTITGTRATVVKDSSTSGFEVAVDYDTNTSSGDINWFAIGH
tara:strand:+ start:834 stop:1523 length:690 start_codon:yes stop_codon:yes gene_type:complete